MGHRDARIGEVWENRRNYAVPRLAPHPPMPWPVFYIFAFLAGSVPFGFLIAMAKRIDIRKHGSGNIGATNVGRVLGRKWGFLCFGLDAAKGAIPVLVAGWSHGLLGVRWNALAPQDTWLWLGVAAAALLGHMYSPWVGFKGGKGVATGFGGLVAMWTPLTLPAVAALLVWVIAVKALRMVSIASMLAAFAIPAAVAIRAATLDDPAAGFRAATPPLVVTGAIALLVVWKHRSNIARAMRGEERKVNV